MKRLTMVMLGALGLAGAGCFSRAHMGENYGRAYKTAFSRQAVNPAGSSAKAPKGLDALESTIIVETYRAQLSPKGGSSSDQQQMILVSPQVAGGMGYSPPIAPASPK